LATTVHSISDLPFIKTYVGITIKIFKFEHFS